MQSFQFSSILLAKRQELHLTQEDVANYVGVTRAAVSKWEKGLSYPDISLLPKLATFFNLSIDRLLGYEPQMTQRRIEELYMEYAKRFATEPFEQVKHDLDLLKNEYYSCYPFLLKVVQLYLNYHSKAEEKEAVLDEGFAIAERVRSFAPELKYVKEATAIQGLIYILQGKADLTLDLIGHEPELDYGIEQLMLTAYTMQGNVEKAKEVAQVAMFQKLLGLASISTETLLISIDGPEYFKETVYKIEELIKLYNLPKLQVNIAYVFYFKAAMGFMMLEQPKGALRMLEKYVETCEQTEFPLRLQGDHYFNTIDKWIQSQTQLMNQAPRDEHSIKVDIIQTVAANPVFAPLHEMEEYKHLVERLKAKVNE